MNKNNIKMNITNKLKGSEPIVFQSQIENEELESVYSPTRNYNGLY
jgi:hypothetical protein